jgi:hypothetical protein
LRYWVDASAFIWANRELFPYNDARVYWNWFYSKVESGDIVTHKHCFDEVVAGVTGPTPDPIAVWLKSRKGQWCSYGDTEESQVIMGEISAYCVKKYSFPVSKQFLNGADARLIARAKADVGVVVCQESERKDPRIPHVCQKFGVQCIPITRMNILLGMKL